MWSDEIFDRHSDLDLEIYTARIDGTPTELQEYFIRTRYYRTVGPVGNVSAFIFIDNDWSAVVSAHTFQLDQLYSRVDIIQDQTDSTPAAYLAKLTGEGAEFVYQWIHSTPRFLRIHDLDEYGGLQLTTIWRQEIARYNFKACFYNLFNCSAARFTEPNLAKEYTVGTDYGLAVIGSTKVGSVIDPRVFHQSLAQGMRWGEAYQKWYNEVGKNNDEWHLGVVIMGDPLLRLSGDLLSWSRAAPSAWEPPPALDEIMETIAAESMLGTFEEYRASHPEFFDD